MILKQICTNCRNIFEISLKESNRRKKYNKNKVSFCSQRCHYAFNKKIVPYTINICPVCCKEKQVLVSFNKRNGMVCCSKRCGWIKEQRRENIVCDYCHKRIITLICAHRRFCSQSCQHKFILSKRIKTDCAACGKSINKTKSTYNRTNLSFCSRNCFEKYFVGVKSSMWRGGISSQLHILRNSSKYIQWRKKIFERDNYRCKKCGKKSYLHPHHINSFAKYPKLRFKLSNGITLCQECHGIIHKINYASRSTSKHTRTGDGN